MKHKYGVVISLFLFLFLFSFPIFVINVNLLLQNSLYGKIAINNRQALLEKNHFSQRKVEEKETGKKSSIKPENTHQNDSSKTLSKFL